MRHRGGITASDDANGFDNANSVDEDTSEATTAASDVSSGGRNCEGGDDDADRARIHRRPVVGTSAGPAEKDVATGGNKIHNNQLAVWRQKPGHMEDPVHVLSNTWRVLTTF